MDMDYGLLRIFRNIISTRGRAGYHLSLLCTRENCSTGDNTQMHDIY
jgi:hypothetical protein